MSENVPVPHEDEWEPYPLDSRIIVRKGTDIVIADIRARLSEDAREVGALISQAPSMARLILSTRRRSNNGAWHFCGCDNTADDRFCEEDCLTATKILHNAKIHP